MRRSLLLLACALAFACEDGTEPLDGSMGLDAGSVRDGGLARMDASVTECDFEAPFTVWSIERPEALLDYEGEVEVVSVDPLVLGGPPQPDGLRALWSFEITNAITYVEVGRMYRAEIHLEEPWWTEIDLVLREPVTEAITLVVWAQSRGSKIWRGAEIAYEDDVCTIEMCGEALTQRLVAFFGEDRLRVAAGDSVWVNGTLSAGNGLSHVYENGPFCTDTPSQWYVGYLSRRVDPVTCDALARDACIAAPGCVLWGSESDDPGYVCLPAATACERNVTRDACNRSNACRWDFGDCYCPEDDVCACGGGPAPRCRDLCDDAAACADGYFCQGYSVALPQCGPSPDQAGFCERVPGDCDNSPNRATCACDPTTGPVSYANDCERRAARASGPQRGMCP